MPRTVERLNAWRPETLVTYASMGRLLAEEQLAGRLRIAPRAVFSASEVLTEETRRRIRKAWGREPFNVYGATVTATIASECEHHVGMHLFEDLVITEVVDDQNRPAAPSVYGAKVLVTVLFSRTQPLIRYEMSDSVRLATDLEQAVARHNVSAEGGAPGCFEAAGEAADVGLRTVDGRLGHRSGWHNSLVASPVWWKMLAGATFRFGSMLTTR